MQLAADVAALRPLEASTSLAASSMCLAALYSSRPRPQSPGRVTQAELTAPGRHPGSGQQVSTASSHPFAELAPLANR